MTKQLKITGYVILLLTLLLAYNSFYIVKEQQQGLLLRLGKIVRIEFPGLHFKVPLLTQARVFDMRLQTLEIKSSRTTTAEQKNVIVDYYVKWRIDDLPLYYTRTSGNRERTDTLLQQQISDNLRAQFGHNTLNNIVGANYASIVATLIQQANTAAEQLGLNVIDVRIKSIDLPDEVSSAVFDRMRADRERAAAQVRATGKANAATIHANADANAVITIATAKAQAAAIRGEGDAQAAKIYADAYNKDPGFYSFYRSLNAYKTVFANTTNNILVLKPDSQFFKYFNGDSGDPSRH